MEHPKTPPNQTLADVLPKLMGFARMVQNLANRFTGLARFLALSGLLSALLLAWLATRAWALSVITAVLLGVFLILPGLVLGWVWYVLEEAGSLPQRLTTWAGQARNYAGEVVQRLHSEPPPAGKTTRVVDLKQLGGLAYEITSMGVDAKDLLSLFGGALSLTNPVFLLVLAIAAGLIVSVCGAYLSWTIMAAEVPFLAATHKAFPRLFARQNSNNAPSASLWLTNISVQVSLVLIWLTGSDYGTLLTIASEMILVPYLLVGAFLLKIATRPLHKAVAIGACIYGIWLLYASGPVHLLLSVVLYAPGLLVFLYARRTHQHDRSLKRREVALIGLLLVAAVPATWMLVG